MAYFNPQPISFNPSPEIMKGASAIGDTMQKLYQQNYMEQQDALKQQQIKDAFNFQKERANTQDQQWQTSFDAGREDKQDANEKWMSDTLFRDMNHKDTVAYQNKQLGLSQQTLGLAQAEAQAKRNKEQAVGLAYANMYPDIAQQLGLTKTSYTAGQQPQPTVPQGMSPVSGFLAKELNLNPYSSQPQQTPVVSKQVVDPTKASMMSGMGEVLKLQDGKAGDRSWQDIGGSKALVDNKTGNVIKTISKDANVFDKTKVAQQTVKALGSADGMVDVINRLVTNYDTTHTGPMDQAMHWVGKYTPLGSEKMATYNQDLTKLTMFNKELENLGAALTPNEQALLQATLPDRTLDDNLYKARLVNYTKTMRDLVRAKVNSSDLAGYKTKDLGQIADKYDALYETAVNKFGDGGSGQQPKKVTQAIEDVEQSNTLISPDQAMQVGISFK